MEITTAIPQPTEMPNIHHPTDMFYRILIMIKLLEQMNEQYLILQLLKTNQIRTKMVNKCEISRK